MYHDVLLNLVAKGKHQSDFASLSEDQKKEVKEVQHEEYLTYILLRQSGPQHSPMIHHLNNSFITGPDRYPQTRQDCLYLFDMFSKSNVVAHTAQAQASSFAQRGGDGRVGNSYDKQFWKNKQCYTCNKKGHPASCCPEKKANGKATAKPKDCLLYPPPSPRH